MTPEQEMRHAALEAAVKWCNGAGDVKETAQQFYEFIAQTNVDGPVVPPESIEYFARRHDVTKQRFQLVTYADMLPHLGGTKLAILRGESSGVVWAIVTGDFDREYVQVAP